MNQFTTKPLILIHSTTTCHRYFSSTLRYHRLPPSFNNRPSPPSLPEKDQKEFENLVKSKQKQLQFNSISNDETLLHPDARLKLESDFNGDINPETGEVGGPKKNPLMYEKEWTYGGRATDF